MHQTLVPSKSHHNIQVNRTATLLKSQGCPIKVKPSSLHFENIQVNQKYEMNMLVRNEGKETERIRIIGPNTHFFSLKNVTNPVSIAPGLNLKIGVYFHLKMSEDNGKQAHQDIVQIIGNNFKTQVALRASKPNFKLKIPKIFQLGIVKQSKETKYEIPIQNTGKEDVQMSMMKASSANILIEEQKIVVKKNSQALISIKINWGTSGVINQRISIPNGHFIELKGVCSNQTIEIYSKEGSLLKSTNLGCIFIGERIVEPFYVSNNSSTKIEGLIKIFDKTQTELHNLKIDQEKAIFISRGNPQKIIESEKQVNTHSQNPKFVVEPYSIFENYLIVQKEPSQQQIQQFNKQIFVDEISNVRDSTWNSMSQIVQWAFIKIIGVDQSFKIPIHFSASVPRIYVTKDKFQFGKVSPKQIKKMGFEVYNYNQKQIKLKFENKGQFYIEGHPTVKPNSKIELSVCFRPIIKGRYYQSLSFSLFDAWTVNLKLFGECQENRSIGKQNMNLTHKQLLLSTCKSTRFMSQEKRKKIEHKQNRCLESKLTERIAKGYIKDTEAPIDLLFDACENPKVFSKKFKMDIQKEHLYFNRQEYMKTLAEKKNAIQTTTARLNVKDIIRFSEQLTPLQLSKIQVKCDRLDFGNVFVGSVSQRDFIINNKNNKPILVQLDLSNELLFSDKSEIKKIQSFSQAKFSIKLKPQHLGALKLPLRYIINKQHIFQIDIVAQVTLINLGFSTNQLNFSFPQSDPSFQRQETLVITNFGTTTTKFVINDPINKAFTIVSAKQQQILPNSFTNVLIKYKPLESQQSDEIRVEHDKISVKVVGGAENIIRCEGKVFQPKCSIKETQINFQQLFVSMQYQNKLTIRNHSKTETSIKIEMNPSCLSQVLNFEQKNFVLGSEERKQVNISLLSHDIKNIKGLIIVSARGGKIFKIPIFLNFVFPSVEVVGVNDVDLGTMHIMTNHFEKQITLLNKTKTQIKLQTESGDSDKMDYFIEFIAAQEKVEFALIEGNQDTERQEQERNKLKKKSIYIEQKLTNNQIKNPKKVTKVITLMPGVETNFKLKFVPKSVKNYEIRIPLIMHKCTRQIFPISQKIRCKAVEPLFYVVPYLITFDNVVITQSEFTNKREFTIINPHNQEVDWEISKQDEEINNLFYFEAYNGLLKPKEEKKIHFNFRPSKEGQYCKKIKLFSRQNKQIKIQLQIIGNAVSPRIGFAKNYLIMPVVPIKTESKALIDIENYGYETVTISKAKFSHIPQGVELRYTFLDGKLLSLAKKKLKMEVVFKSENPLSFTTNLEIYDEFGDKLTIPVSATADGCVLTTYSYLQINNSTIVYDTIDNVLKLLVSKSFNIKCKPINLSGSSAVTGNFIKKWCNYELNINVENFPDSLIQSKGSLLYEIVIKMANGRPILKKPNFQTEQKLSKMLELYDYYSQAINTLQIEGAFLNHIRPEHLLNMNDYLMYMLHKGFIIEEDEFECLSHDAWTVIFYQLCKLYVEPAINQKFIQKLNIRYRPDKAINSCIYSENEIYILGFINQFLGDDKVYSLSDQTKIFIVIQRIMEKTFKVSLSEELAKLKLNADSLMMHQFLIHVSKFLQSHLQQYGLSMYLQPNDLFTMGYKEYILFFISLMQNLLNYQNCTVVQFDSGVGEKNDKIIELENPSKKKKIKYWVKLFGSPNFKANQKFVEIDPEQAKQIKISYHCKKSYDEEAQILLIPVKEENYFTHTNTLSFILKNTLISKTIIKKITMKVHLYDIKSFSFDFEIPSTETAQFDLKLIGHQFQDDFQYPSYYLMQPGPRIVRGGKEKCEVKIAPMQLRELSFKVILVSAKLQQYVYEFYITVILPHQSTLFKLDPILVDKQQMRVIRIPVENELKQQCIRFHKQMNKDRQKTRLKTRRTQLNSLKTIKKCNGKESRHKYQVSFLEESFFRLDQLLIQVGTKQKNEKNQNLNRIEIFSEFTRAFRQYRSILLVKNQLLNDYRLYGLITSVSIKPKVFNIKMFTKAREVYRLPLSIKTLPFTFKLLKNVPQLQAQPNQQSQIILTFSPSWKMKDQVQLMVQNTETFEQHIYKIKLQSSLPDPVQVLNVKASTLFETIFAINLKPLHLSQKQFHSHRIVADIHRKHELKVKWEDGQKIEVLLKPSEVQTQSSIKLMIPKSDEYYQYLIKIKNVQAMDLGVVNINSHIGESKSYILKDIEWSPFCNIEYEKQDYFYVEKVEGDKKAKQSLVSIILKSFKELDCEKIFRIKSEEKEYILKVHFEVAKLEPTLVPIILTQNLEKKSTAIIVVNSYEADGVYETHLDDTSRFRIENHSLEMKSKQKAQLKIVYCPQFIGESSKTTLTLRSQTLPQLTYFFEGMSKFKFKQQHQQIEAYEGVETQKQIAFTNQFPQKERFRFELLSRSQSYYLSNNQNSFIKDIQPKEVIKFKVRNSNPTYIDSQPQQSQNRITVTRMSSRKAVKQYILKLSVVKNLEDKQYTWDCRARSTIFQTIKLPNSYALQQIKADSDILKYISFNIEEKYQNEAKIKFSPMKPIKEHVCNILLLTNKIKFRIRCRVKVSTPPIDDIITIKTSQILETRVAVFRLTNVFRETAFFKAYFLKGYQELEVDPCQGVLEAYGKNGTPITVRFKSQVHNKRAEDKLVIETDYMYWIFKVIGLQEKQLSFDK